jgi:transcriptional regulator with XRE-family HTH domain
MAKKSITFGQEIQRLRRRQGISQFDLAVCMEWKGTNPVIQIEKDRRVPKPDTIDKLGKCLGLNYLEVNYLNGLAGHILPTRLPPREYVIDTLDAIGEALKTFPYPAYVVDYQFRIWLANRATALFTGGDLDVLRDLLARPLNTFDMIFDSSIGMRGQIDELHYAEIDQVFRFKATNSFRQHEPFYLNFLDDMRRLEPDDYRALRTAWEAIDANSVTSYRSLDMREYLARLEHGDIRLVFSQGKVAFHIRADSVLHLRDLFTIVTIAPVATALYADNRRLAEQVSRQFAPDEGSSIKLWELMDIVPFFA